jgi:type III pantothenate kinase
MHDPTPRLLAVHVGNSNTRWALFDGNATPKHPGTRPSDQTEDLATAIEAAARRLGEFDGSLVVVSSTNNPAAEAFIRAVEPRLNQELLRVGTDVKVPIEVATDRDAKTGQDRLLNALAAYDVYEQACVIVDAGTAVTVDFVDGDGVFQGGAIAPGARMALMAMHEHTAALPRIEAARPDDRAFGRNTEQAMLNGMYYSIRGLVRTLVERYAEAFGAFPPVIATGGDAIMLFENDEFIDKIVPDLTLRGIAGACGLQAEGKPEAKDEPKDILDDETPE